MQAVYYSLYTKGLSCYEREAEDKNAAMDKASLQPLHLAFPLPNRHYTGSPHALCNLYDAYSTRNW